MSIESALLQDLRDELGRYRAIGEKALRQIPDSALDHTPVPGGNSPAVIVRHMSGNFVSRFTDFLTTDGEKPWRDRDREFESPRADRAELERLWSTGWSVVESALAELTGDDLSREVRIRGLPLSVHAALTRSVAHAAYHVGQLVLLARISAAGDWEWISIPPGESQAYNLAPVREKRP